MVFGGVWRTPSNPDTPVLVSVQGSECWVITIYEALKLTTTCLRVVRCLITAASSRASGRKAERVRDSAAMKPVRVSAKPSAKSGDTRFAVVTMTRMPYRFEDWLKYYRALGTDHLFIAVEESPEVEMLLAEAPWCDMVTTSRSKPEQNPYETVITRQERVMAWALGECERCGIPWLFHLDDDELLHFGQPWEETVAQVPPEATCLVVRNVEGVPDNDHSDFTTISRFAVGNETGWPMLAYINGKAAGRVGACSQMGPHRFTGAARPGRPGRPAAPPAPPPRRPRCRVTRACVP